LEEFGPNLGMLRKGELGRLHLKTTSKLVLNWVKSTLRALSKQSKDGGNDLADQTIEIGVGGVGQLISRLRRQMSTWKIIKV
jgi:hypothetical protein